MGLLVIWTQLRKRISELEDTLIKSSKAKKQREQRLKNHKQINDHCLNH